MSQQGYIGRNPGDGRTIVNRQTTHVTTGVQTSFTMTVGYEVGYLDVYLNGIKQTETLDYTASDGSTIDFALSYPPVNGDVLEFVAFETLNISNIKSARRNFSVGQDLDVSGKVTIGSSLTVASDLVVNGTFTTINTEILDVEDKTVGIASTSSPSNTTADGAGIVIYGGSDGDKSLTWNSTKSNFVLVGGGVSIGTGVTISTPAANVLAFSVNSAEKARFNNFGAFTVGYEGEAWHESTYVGVLQAGSGAWIGQTPGASARAEWVNNAYYDSVNTRWEYIAADEANRIVLENGELKVQSADAGSADGAITWNEKLKMTVGGDFKIGAPTGIGVTVSSSGNIDAIGIVTASSFVGNGANLTSLNASNIGSGTVPTARLGSGTASSSTFLRGDSTFQTVDTNLVADTSPQLGGALDTNGNNINFGDSTGGGADDRLVFGAGSDLNIYSDGTNARYEGDNLYFKNAAGDEFLAKMINGGSVELYHNNSRRLETSSTGIIVKNMTGSAATKLNIVGPEGNDGILNLIADDGDDDADHWRALSSTDGSFYIQNYTAGSWEWNLRATGNGSVDLYYNHAKKFETMSTGAYVEGYLNFPDSGGTRIGSGNDIVITHNGSNSSITNNTGGFYISGDGTDLHLRSAAHTTFSTGGSNERMRISSDGQVLIGTTTAGGYTNRKLVVGDTSESGNFIEIRTSSSGTGHLLFADSAAGDANNYTGYVAYTHSNNSMTFHTNGGNERFRFGSAGQLGIGGANYGSSGQVLTSQGSSSAPTWAAASGGKVVNYSSTTVTAAGSASVGQGSYSNNIIGISYAAASSSNKLLLIASVSVGYQHGQSVAARFSVSGSAITGSTGDADGNRRRATTAAWLNSQYQVTNMNLTYQHSSPSTSAVTYGVQLGQSDNSTQTVYWNRSYDDSNHDYRIRAATTLTIIELEG